MSAQVFGIIAPHPPIMVEQVGGSRASMTDDSSAAMNLAAELLAQWNPDTVVIMSPHAPSVSQAFAVEMAARVSGDLGQFGAPDVSLSFAGDPQLAKALIAGLVARGIPAVARDSEASLRSGTLDHAVLVPMSYLDRSGRWPLLVLSLSWLPYEAHRILGEELTRAASDLGRRIAFVASGDCSHRLTRDAPAGFDPAGMEFDRLLVEHIEASDFGALESMDSDLVERAGECGLRSFVAIGGATAPAHARVLAYEGPWGVGYLSAVVNEQLVLSLPDEAQRTPRSGSKGGAAGESESEIVQLARLAITTYLGTGEVLEPPPLTDVTLPDRAGAFVSLHRGGDLRGCIGTIAPTESTLATEVVRNAIQASTEDPRFPPMTTPELEDLDITVDVLHPSVRCEFADLDPSKFGVIVTHGWKRGLLLPDLEGVDSAEQQVDIARRKAGIGPTETIRLERFSVERYV